MKYIYSANECSLYHTSVSLNCINNTKLTGVIIYSGIMIVIWCVAMGTWPGDLDALKVHDWFTETYYPIQYLSLLIWALLNIVSTIFSILGIVKILKMLHLMKRGNQKVETNKFILTLHCVVLLLNLIVVIFYSLPHKCFTKWLIVDTMLVVSDTIT
jgi:hypothetical protein